MTNQSVRRRRLPGRRPPSQDELASAQRRIRLLILLDAAERAGLAPIPILHLHTLAYFSNVLAPVWDMPVLDGKVLKVQGGPFYPALQADLDNLVGMGLVAVSNVGHVRRGDGHWRLEGSFALNHDLATPAIVALETFADEVRLQSFIRELAYAFSSLSDDELDVAASEDASYGDPLVSIGNVVDFDEWRKANYSALAAEYFDQILPSMGRAAMAEKLYLYTRHLRNRLHASA